MKSALTTLLIFSFLIVAIFGTLVMGHSSDHSHGGCLAATVQGTDCPKEENSFAFLNFHLDAFRSFSTVIFSEKFVSAFVLLVALVLTAVLGVISTIGFTQSVLIMNYWRRQFLEAHSLPFQRELIHWLALHENSPATL